MKTTNLKRMQANQPDQGTLLAKVQAIRTNLEQTVANNTALSRPEQRSAMNETS